MSDTSKRKVNARRIADDICSGMDDDRLKWKYGLSDRQLQAVKRKLVILGLIPEARILGEKGPASEGLRRASVDSQKKPIPSLSDVEHVTAPRNQPSGDPVSQTYHEWTCPACGLRQARKYDECPRCGIVVAKLSAGRQSGPHPAQLAGRWPKEKESASGSGWGIVALGLAALIIVGMAIFKWSSPGKGPTAVPVSTIGGSHRPADISEDSSEAPESPATPSEDATASSEGSPKAPQAALPEEPTEAPEGPAVAHEAPAKVSKRSAAPSVSSKYETGFVKAFTVPSFEREVLAASREFPVLVEFYSDT